MSSDNKEAELITAVAVSFAYDLRRQLGYEAFQRVILANDREANPAVCHSHDECDANLVMAKACRRHRVRPETEYGRRVWNLAWSEARRMRFWATYEDTAYATDAERRRMTRPLKSGRG